MTAQVTRQKGRRLRWLADAPSATGVNNGSVAMSAIMANQAGVKHAAVRKVIQN